MKTKRYIFTNLSAIALMFIAGCRSDTQFYGSNAEQKKPETIMTKEFPVASIGQERLTIKPSFGQIDQLLTLKAPPVTTNLRQIERPFEGVEYTQGHAGSKSNESFSISNIGKVDVLVVIDNSGSMSDEQTKLKDKLPALTRYLSTTDWQIAVITTDNSCLSGAKLIKKIDATADTDFSTAIAAGINGSGDEKGIKYAQLALMGKCQNGDYNWLRNDASLAVLFVTDENNVCKEQGNEPCEQGNRPKELISLMKNLRGDRAKAYGLTWKQNENGCNNTNGENEGTRYEEVINSTGGFRGSICSNDYTTTLEKISRDVARSIRYEFDLKFQPDKYHFKVMIDGQEYKDFDIVGTKIRLKNIAGTETKLTLDYSYGSTPMLDHFIVNNAAEDTLKVWVNGKAIPESEFYFEFPDQEVFLVDLPPDDAKITIKYRRNDALKADFDLSGEALIKTPDKVLVNGREVTDYTYNIDTKTLSFSNPPLDSSEIRVLWYEEQNSVTQYDFTNFDKRSLRGISVIDAKNASDIPYDFKGGILELPMEEVVDGREVIVRFQYGDAHDVLSHELIHDPILESVVIHSDNEKSNCSNLISLTGKILSFQCMGDTAQSIDVSYDYIDEGYNSFDIGPLPKDLNLMFSVYIDQENITLFERRGSVFIIPKELLKPQSIVKIVVNKIS